MILLVTVRELSCVLPFCQFCHFLIYISVRFIYISVTFSFSFFILPKSLPCHFYPAMRAICGILLILNSFFLPKRLPKLATLATKMTSY